jgi:hypothetical protein
MLTHTTHALESKDVRLVELTAKQQAALTDVQTTKVCTLLFTVTIMLFTVAHLSQSAMTWHKVLEASNSSDDTYM